MLAAGSSGCGGAAEAASDGGATVDVPTRTGSDGEGPLDAPTQTNSDGASAADGELGADSVLALDPGLPADGARGALDAHAEHVDAAPLPTGAAVSPCLGAERNG